MGNYLVLTALILFVLPASGHAAPTPADASLVGKTFCGHLYGADGTAAAGGPNMPAVATCVTVESTDTTDRATYSRNDGTHYTWSLYRTHRYGTINYLAVGIIAERVDAPDGSSTWPVVDARIFSDAAKNKPDCPDGDRRQDGTIGPVRGTGHKDFWTSTQGLADMKTMCNLEVTACDPGANCGSGGPATEPNVAKPVAPTTVTCAPLAIKRLHVVIKTIDVACGSARNVMSRYLKSGKEPAGFMCVRVATKKSATAKCRSVGKAKGGLITGSWKR